MKIKKNNVWWGAPTKFAERKSERKVSWLELFFDLAYVATISQLMQHLSENLNWLELGFTLFIFAFIYWSWSNGSLYHDIHGNNAIRTRLFSFIQIISIAAVAVTLNDLFMGNHTNFAVAFSTLQLIITYLWWSTGHYDRSHKPLNKFYVINYSSSAILLILSIFTSYKVAIFLWSIALILNLSTSLVSATTIKKELKKRGEQFSISKTMVERYGLFAIIALGETIFGITETISKIPIKGIIIWLEFSNGMIISFLLWWIYFGMVGAEKLKSSYRYFVLIDYLNLILLFAIGTVGAVIRTILVPSINSSTSIYWIFYSALITILIMIVLLSTIRVHTKEEHSYANPMGKMALLSAFLILILGCFSNRFSHLALMIILTFILIIPVLSGTIGWIKFKINSTK